MDNPSNINDIKIALELHKAAEEQLAIGRKTIDKQAMEASGLKEGDVVAVNNPIGDDFNMEVYAVNARLSASWRQEPVYAYIRVYGSRLNKDGTRRLRSPNVSALLKDVTLVRRAEDNG